MALFGMFRRGKDGDWEARQSYGNDVCFGKGKHYIMSMFMESIYLNRKYWRNLQPVNLGKERLFPHLHSLEDSITSAYSSCTAYGRARMGDDLCQLLGPVSDDSICQILHQRFLHHVYHTFLGPTLIAINPQTHRLPHKALTCSRGLSKSLQLLVKNVVEDVTESRQSHSVIVGGDPGSGKTRISMEVLRHLYDLVGGGSVTDAFKLISAALTALRPFDTTATASNQESSRSCWMVQCTISSHAITSSQLTVNSLSYNRFAGRPSTERSYDVFYMMIVGMSPAEREHCHLCGHTEDSLVYLRNSYRKAVNVKKYQEKYSYWKNSLLTLGINHTEVLKVLAAVLLIGNFTFVKGDDAGIDINGADAFKAVSNLLDVSATHFYQSLAHRSYSTQNHIHTYLNTPEQANKLRHCLAQSLYSRLCHYLTRKVNQTTETCVPAVGNKRDTAASSEPRNIYVIDSLALQHSQGTQMEQFCANICAEAVQHFCNMTTFNQLVDAYDDDNIALQRDVRWYDNSSTIQLLTQQNIGVVSLLHTESQEERPNIKSLMRKLEKTHSNSDTLQVRRHSSHFTVQHYGGRISYDCESLMLEDRNSIPDDLIVIFSKQFTSFNLLSKLYSKELKDLSLIGGSPRGGQYRMVPCQPRPCDIRPSSYSQDFLCGIDRLMQTLACSNSTFVRCIKASPTSAAHAWDTDFVLKQMACLELTEAVKLLTGGLPHKMTYKEFTSKYQCLTCSRRAKRTPSTQYYQDYSQDIINQYLHIMEVKSISYSSANWVFGHKHLFLSDDTSRQLDMLRAEVRQNAACRIQSTFRGWLIRQSWPAIMRHRQLHQKGVTTSYDSGYNTPLSHKASTTRSTSAANITTIEDHNLLKSGSDQTFHWKSTFKNMQEMEAPALPEKRRYSVKSGMKVYFPQIRVMKETVNVEGYELGINSEVLCIGYSSRPSHVSIAFQNDILDVPFDKTSIRISGHRQQAEDVLVTDL